MTLQVNDLILLELAVGNIKTPFKQANDLVLLGRWTCRVRWCLGKEVIARPK